MKWSYFLFPLWVASAAMVENVQGILLVGSLEESLQETSGIVSCGLEVPGAQEDLQKLLTPYLGKTVESGKIVCLIEDYYAKRGYPFVAVKTPSDSPLPNTLAVLVVESKVGKVIIEDTPCKTIQNNFRLKSGDLLNETVLLEDLQFINRIPFHVTSASFLPGEQTGTTNISLKSIERPAFRLFTGLDNTGTEPLGHNRWFTGGNYANMFGLGHLLSFQVTGSTHLNRFKSVTVNYTAPLSWRHTLFVYGGGSWVKAPIAATTLSSHGVSAQASFRYQIPLSPSKGLLHELSFGGDYKFTNNFLQFEEGTIASPNSFVNILQWMAGYNLNYQTHAMNLSFETEIFCSPGDAIPHQSTSDYDAFRGGAKPLYVYGRSAIMDLWRGPRDMSVFLSLRGQYSSANLLPSEQLGIGGYDTVRGYEERTLNVDNGLIANFELRSPLIRFLQKSVHFQTQVYFLGFVDYGVGVDHKAGDQHPSQGWLCSIGPGARLNIDRFLSVRADYGFKLHHRPEFDGSIGRFHFSFIGSF